jgi:hypothetical protein
MKKMKVVNKAVLAGVMAFGVFATGEAVQPSKVEASTSASFNETVTFTGWIDSNSFEAETYFGSEAKVYRASINTYNYLQEGQPINVIGTVDSYNRNIVSDITPNDNPDELYRYFEHNTWAYSYGKDSINTNTWFKNVDSSFYGKKAYYYVKGAYTQKTFLSGSTTITDNGAGGYQSSTVKLNLSKLLGGYPYEIHWVVVNGENQFRDITPFNLLKDRTVSLGTN